MLIGCVRPLNKGITPTRLFSLNREVDSINESKLKEIPETSKTFRAADAVSQPTKNLREEGAEKHPAFASMRFAKTLTLKIGAEVMLLWNVDVSRGLCNGSRGKVVGYTRDRYLGSRKKRSDQEAKWLSGTPLIPLVQFVAMDRPIPVECQTMEVNPTLRRTGARRIQIPLCLAWAITCHKSQGLTIDCCQMDLSGAFAEGQVYTALSRVRNMEGLELLRPLKMSDIKTDIEAADYYSTFEMNQLY